MAPSQRHTSPLALPALPGAALAILRGLSPSRARLGTLGILLTAHALAHAAPKPSHPVLASATSAQPYDLVLGELGELAAPRSARQLVPQAPTTPGSSQLAHSRTIYLNKNGVTLQPAAVNDARQDRSTIATQPTIIPPWAVDATTWNATVTCLREIFAPFAVKIVTSDPGAELHLEAVFGGEPTLLGLPRTVAGVSPFTTSCSIIESSMVFVFTAALPVSARGVCEIMAQEIAHSYGLDHELLAADPMTYLPYQGKRWFQEQLAPCGEYTARPCGIGTSSCRATQSSLLLLRQRLGVADAVPPQGSLITPLTGDSVGSTFTIEATATDNIAIAEVVFLLDGTALGSLAEPPYQLTVKNIAAGEHVLTAEFVDQGRNVLRATATITVEDSSTHGLLAGCHAAGDSPGPLPLLLAWLLPWWRTRRRQAPAR